MQYPNLFRPGKIGGLTIKNRAVMVPMGTDYANHDGTASMRLIRYYEERARGGIGLIINEYTGVDEVNSVPSNHNLRAACDYHIASLEQLTEAVHRYGCRIFAQIHHGGSTSKPALSGRQSLSASDVPPAPGGPVPRAMTVAEIGEAVQKFVDAAVRCKRAGYDGVELHGAHSYLIGQFFSPYYNKRTDQYGGCFENRMRFLDEIIDGIRAVLGPRYPISVRICGDEMTPDIPGTLTLADGLQIGEHLEKKGIDVINVSNGSALNGNANCDPYSYKPGWKKHVAKAFKDRLSIPVIATNTIKEPGFAESLLEEDICDFVGLGRSQFADPFFTAKAREGRAEDIRPCIGCMVCRERLLQDAMPVACAVNARIGREYILGEPKCNGGNRPVVVVGGGPGGMETARVLAERGFSVTLFEKQAQLGGTLNLADKPPHKELITRLTTSMATALQKRGVDIRLGTAATPDLVAELAPVGIFIATGAEPVVPPLPGMDGNQVCTAEAFIRGDASPTGSVAVIGTGLTGLESAEMLLEKGHSVTLVEMQPQAGPGLFAVIRNDILGRLQKYTPAILTGHKLVGIAPGNVQLQKQDGQSVTVCADWVVLALGIRPPSGVVESFEAVCTKVFTIGDAAAGGRIYEAIRDGYDKAYVFEA